MVDRRPDAWFATDAVITIHRKGESAGSVVTTDVGNLSAYFCILSSDRFVMC